MQPRTTHHHTTYFISLLKEGLLAKWLGMPWMVVGVFIVFRDELWRPADESKWRIMTMIPHLSLAWWLVVALAIIIIWVFEASFRLTRKLEARIDKLMASAPFEIIFDSSNPARRFWSRESPRNEDGNKKPGLFWEYRVEIKNNSFKTVRNVSVTTEHTGQLPIRPQDQIFDKIRKTVYDIKPQSSELVAVICWPIPEIQRGMLSGPSALEYGPLKVTVSGDDVLPATRIFRFDYQQTPMIFD